MVTAYAWITGPSRSSVTTSGAWSRAGNWIPAAALGQGQYRWLQIPVQNWQPTPGAHYQSVAAAVKTSCSAGGNANLQCGITADSTENFILDNELRQPAHSSLNGRNGWATVEPVFNDNALASYTQLLSAHQAAAPNAKFSCHYVPLGLFKKDVPKTDAEVEAVDPNGSSLLTAGDAIVAGLVANAGFLPVWAYAVVTVAKDGFEQCRRWYRMAARHAKQVRNAYGNSGQQIVLYVWWKAVGAPYPYLEREDYRAFFEACVLENVDGAILAKADDAAEALLVQSHYNGSWEPGRGDAIVGVTPPPSYWSGARPYVLNNGGVRTARMAFKTFPTSTEYRLGLTNTAHNVKAILFSDAAGLNCWEVGVEGINVVVRKVVWGVPQAASATATHGVTANVPFTLGVRIEQGAIKVYVNGMLKTSFTPDAFLDYVNVGFVSDVADATVTLAEFCELIPTTQGAATVLAAVCGGDVFLAEDESAISKIAARVFQQSGAVALAVIDQKIIGVDGQTCQIIDPVAGTVAPFVPSAGELPGATMGVPGSTTATIVVNHLGRLWFAGMKDDPQNAVATAIDDYLDLDFFDLDKEGGKAYSLTLANAGKIGQPVKALCSLNRLTLLVGCESSFWRIVGDPSLALPIVERAYTNSGVSGKDAMISLDDGRGIAHSPDGLILLPAGGEGVNLSETFLTTGFNIPQSDVADYLVQVRLEAALQSLYVMRTPVASGEAQHFEYSKRIGGFAPGAPALFPIDFDDSIGPTASTPEPWRGSIVWGTRDGRLCRFNRQGTYTDLDEFPIPCRFSLTPLYENPGGDTILSRVDIDQARASDAVQWQFYGGRTVEDALLGDDRRLLAAGEMTFDRKRPIVRRVRAPALVIELANAAAGENIQIESVNALFEFGSHTRRQSSVAAPVPDAFCTATVGGGEPDPDPDPPASGPGSGGGSTPPGALVPISLITTKVLVVPAPAPKPPQGSVFFAIRGITTAPVGSGIPTGWVQLSQESATSVGWVTLAPSGGAIPATNTPGTTLLAPASQSTSFTTLVPPPPEIS